MSAPDGHNAQAWLEYIGNNTSAEGSLPTGAATAAKQDTGNTSLASILAAVVAGIPLDGPTLAALETIQIGSIAAGENHLGAVGGHSTMVTGSVTRPNDTTGYTAGDAVNDAASGTSTPISFANAVRVAAGSAVITAARLVRSVASGTLVASTFRLWLYAQAPSSPINDNAAFTISAAAKAYRIGYIDFTATPISNGSSVQEYYGTPVFANGIPYKLASGTTLYGLNTTLTAFAPLAQEVYDFYLYELQD